MLKEMIDKKYLIIIIGFGAILAFVFGLKFILSKPTSEKIEDYIKKQGYQLSNDGVYTKTTSTLSKNGYDTYVRLKKNARYSINKFDKYNFELSEEIYEYDEGITSYLLETYNYQTNLLDYNYRITGNSINVLFMGNYDISKKEFTCNKELSYGVSLNNTEKVMCDKVKLNVLTFMTYADSFFSNALFDNYIKNYVDNGKVND